MNIHAHLSKNEVIGYLAGTQAMSAHGKPGTLSPHAHEFRCVALIVQRAYPCESISQKKRNHNAEMCPQSAVATHELIQSAGQEIVGWYHSHPDFKVDPSNIDIQNHCTHQHDFEQQNKPMIAAIIGPYTK